MEKYFEPFRKQIIGTELRIKTPYHESIPLIYTDWTASGRMYQAIEDRMLKNIYPMVANTHTDTTDTGMAMTYAYHHAKEIIRQHVGAGQDDILLSCSSGMTGVINKFQRILGWKVHESHKNKIQLSDEERPVIFVTHMEHHSNQLSWSETLAEVVIVQPDDSGLVSLDNFRAAIQKYADRKVKVCAITSCSNVTGIYTPYMDIAEMIHHAGGLCFVDFACSAPYIHIDMHEDDAKERYLDALYFSPHKFLGGPGSSGILLFNKKLYKNRIPDIPGGGTVDWTNPWGGHKYLDNIEEREDGGTPSFLQTIRVAMCCKLKEEMGVENIERREKEINSIIWNELESIPNLHILAPQHKERQGIFSFYIDDLRYNLAVKMLNDKFGIQTRGGCSCAGTYGHYLLHVDEDTSKRITELINVGDNTLKPGWIRMSIHPTLTDEEIKYVCASIKNLAENFQDWKGDYEVDLFRNIIRHKNDACAKELTSELDACFEETYQ